MRFEDLFIPAHEGIPPSWGPPTLDGYVEPEPGVPQPNRAEGGYARGARFAWTGGAVAPKASFRGVRIGGQDAIVLAFNIRYDPSFDDKDRIVIVLHPTPGAAGKAHDALARRIDILPINDVSGANGPRDDPNDSAYELRTKREPRDVVVYSPRATDMRYWEPMQGYTKISSSAFVHTSTTGDPKLTTTSHNWSVEVTIPTSTEDGNEGAHQWIDLVGDFGLYVNLVRLSAIQPTGTPPPVPIQRFYSLQFTWPWDDMNATAQVFRDPQTGTPPDPKDWEIRPSWLGKAHLGTPGETNTARGVRFAPTWPPVGNRRAGTTEVGTLIDATGNTMVAQVVNTAEAADAKAVQATFRLANWGLEATLGAWTVMVDVPTAVPPIHGIHDNPTAAKDIAHGGAVDLTGTWDQVPASYSETHQCLWVTLDAQPTPAGVVNFVESSERVNMDFTKFSSVERTAYVSGRGFPPPPGGGATHDFLLHQLKIPLPLPGKVEPGPEPEPEPGPEPVPVPDINVRGEDGEYYVPDPAPAEILMSQLAIEKLPTANWLWVVLGWRRTGDTLTVDGRRYEIHEQVGEFGYIATHELQAGETVEGLDLYSEITGPGLTHVADGVYRLKVPHNGVVELETKVETGPAIPPDAEGCGPLAFLRRLVARLKKLLGA